MNARMLLWPSYDEFVEQYTPKQRARIEQRKDTRFPFYPHGDVDGTPSRELREALLRASQISGGRVVGLVSQQLEFFSAISSGEEEHSSGGSAVSVQSGSSLGMRLLRESAAKQAYRVYDNPRYTRAYLAPSFVLDV